MATPLLPKASGSIYDRPRSGWLPENWDNFARLFKAGLDGIDAGRGQAPHPLIMLHYDQGADTKGAKRFYDTFNGYGIPYDIIGLSYYPWWHGNLLGLRDNVLSILENYPAKDVIVVEVGYRPHEYEETELAPYPSDAPGGPRKAFLEAVNQTLLSIPSRRIKGIFWWEPASGCARLLRRRVQRAARDHRIRSVQTLLIRSKNRRRSIIARSG